MTTPGRWQRYPDVWYRTPLKCSGCHAETREPFVYGWSFVEDISGHRIARCRRCAPVSMGKAGDRVFGGRAVAPRRRAAEEERDD